MENKIKSAESFVDEEKVCWSPQFGYTISDVEVFIQAAQRQAIEATLEFTGNYLCKIHKANPNINIMPETYKTLINLIEADELKVS